MLTTLLFLATAGSACAATARYVWQGSPSPAPPYTSWATAARTIQLAVDAAVAGDEIVVSNGVYNTGGQAVFGSMTNRVAVTKPLTVRSVNGPEWTIIQGYQVPGSTNGDGAIRCVYLTNGVSLSGFTLTNGATANTASYYDPENYGGGAWCESGAVISNCVIVGNSAQQLGGGAYRGTLNNCILTRNMVPGSSAAGGGAYQATLNDCTLSNNAVRLDGGFGGGVANSELNLCTLVGNRAGGSGGGALMSVLNNCTLFGNLALYGDGGGAFVCTLTNCILTENSAPGTTVGGGGGGASGSVLYNCVLSRNTAGRRGGGGYQCDLYNCTITGNSAPLGGGLYLLGGTVCNCIINYNTASSGADYCVDPDPNWGTSIFAYCCTTPLPAGGFFNITAGPRLVDYINGNVRLQSDSPCINAGRNVYASSPMDLDGNPRIVSGTVDIGAYEFQGTGSRISYAWLQQYNLPTDGSADFADPDADGHNTWQEWRCLTVPTNGLSVLRLLSASPTGSDVTVSWQSVAGVNYFLEHSTSLASPLLFTPLATGIAGQPGTTTFTDTNAVNAPRLFYRVGVKE